MSEYPFYFTWSAQGAAKPLELTGGDGAWFTTKDGSRWLDLGALSYQVNVGHGNRRIVEAIKRQADELCVASPNAVFPAKLELAERLLQLAGPGFARGKVFFTLGGAEAIENAIKIARQYTGRYKILARYRAYHGATMGAMTLTGDPRRWATEPGLVGVVRYPDTHRWGEREPRPVEESLRGLEDVIMYEGPHTIAAIFLETIVGTNGVLIPPDGYIQGVRELCDRHGILMVADEVMAGFGRSGRWFAIEHWNTVPDLMTMAKGLTSSYLPLGAVAIRRHVAEKFDSMMFYGGLTYSSHPISLAASLATLNVYEEDHLIERAAAMDPVMRAQHERLAARHPSIGAYRNLGLFGILDLVRRQDPYTPMTKFNASSEEMIAIGRYLREHGVYTMISNNSIHTNPPLCISEEELAHGFEVIDGALSIADQAVQG